MRKYGIHVDTNYKELAKKFRGSQLKIPQLTSPKNTQRAIVTSINSRVKVTFTT